ncbi:MAG: hypothetical protein P0Y60_01825 [Candidatus Microbacterium colombiense]|nr:MAG: hypothetical protein P0Y60_01825 [Microbacterium sp.]
MQILSEIYRKTFVAGVIVISVLSAASAVLLMLGTPPRISRIDPAIVTIAVVSMLVLFGTVGPLIALLVWSRRRRPSILLAIVFIVVMFSHAVSLGEPVAVPGQSLTSMLALVLGGLTGIAILVLAIENHRAVPVPSAL